MGRGCKAPTEPRFDLGFEFLGTGPEMGLGHRWTFLPWKTEEGRSTKSLRLGRKVKLWLRGFHRKRQTLSAVTMAHKKPQNPTLIAPSHLRNPKEFYKLYEDELESDVILLVGPEGWKERVPAHSWVLANSNDFFRALFCGPLSNNSRVHSFPDDPKGFNNLIRWLYQNKCDLQSLQSSLDTLSVAIKYLCPELAERCIIHLRSQLTPSNVIRVLRWIYLYCYCPSKEVSSPEPSAPCLADLEDSNHKTSSSDTSNNVDPTDSCHLLLNECLELIDLHSDAVLNSESLILAETQVLQMVLRRDTLTLSSELKVLKALHKWSTALCKRQHLPLTTENRRSVLGPLLYLARLLTLSPSDVEILVSKQGETSHLLTKEELSFIHSYTNRQPLPPVPSSMSEHVSAMSISRGQRENTSTSTKNMLPYPKEKQRRKKFHFNKKEIILDLVSLLGLIFD